MNQKAIKGQAKNVTLIQSFSGDIEMERRGIDKLFFQNRPKNVRVEWYLMLKDIFNPFIRKFWSCLDIKLCTDFCYSGSLHVNELKG